ncbi:MAG: glycoside hydrolase family 3 protein, partial [Novosphingobium sp.]
MNKSIALSLLLATVASTSVCAASGQAGYRDLNHNGMRDPYENNALPVSSRIDDLLGRMTLEEKVALMLHGTLAAENGQRIGVGTAYDKPAAQALLARGVNSFITRLSPDARSFARENNAIQTMAAATRLGIPATNST